jgi:hypothetical protein
MSKKDQDSQDDNDKDDQSPLQQQQQQKDELRPQVSDSKSKMPSSLSSNKGKDGDDQNDPFAGLKSVLTTVFDVINTVWSVVILFLGVTVSCGLVLNLFGYGYQVNPEAITVLFQQQKQQQTAPSSSLSASAPPPLLRIDTIDRFRQETQFKREIFNSMKEKRQNDAAAAAAAAATTTTTTDTAKTTTMVTDE